MTQTQGGANAPQTRADIVEQYQKKSAELNALMWEKSNEIDTIITKIKSVEVVSEKVQTTDTLQNSEQPHNPNKWEELAQYREIGERTRDMLIAHGKITDAASVVSKVFNEEYKSDAEAYLQPFYDDINDCQKKLLDLMCMLIDANLNRTDEAII